MCKIHLQRKLLKDMGSNLHIQQHILRPQILGSAGRGWIIFFSTWSIELMGLVGWGMPKREMADYNTRLH